MNIAIITTQAIADQNIKKHLDFEESEEEYKGKKILTYQNIKLYETDEQSIYCEGIDKEIDADIFVFATKHKSESGKPTLTCHAPGNWNKAEYGGKEKTLCLAPAYYLKQFYLALKQYEGKTESEISLEVTHHGPLLEKPCMFVEIGSSEIQWRDERFGKIIADCIKEVFTKESKVESCFFIGGGHYNNYANKIMEMTDLAVGHICPKYAVEFIDEEMIQQALEKTFPKSELVILDWNGLGGHKQRLVEILEKLNVKYERAKRILKN